MSFFDTLSQKKLLQVLNNIDNSNLGIINNIFNRIMPRNTNNLNDEKLDKIQEKQIIKYDPTILEFILRINGKYVSNNNTALLNHKLNHENIIQMVDIYKKLIWYTTDFYNHIDFIKSYQNILDLKNNETIKNINNYLSNFTKNIQDIENEYTKQHNEINSENMQLQVINLYLKLIEEIKPGTIIEHIKEFYSKQEVK